jgi:integrase/recombinase XerC
MNLLVLPKTNSPQLTQTPQSLLSAFLGSKAQGTLLGYQKDLKDFAAFLGVETTAETVQVLLQNQGQSNALVCAYKNHLLARQLQSATINRRLSALCSMVKLARTFGMCAFSLDVEWLPNERFRDTKGPGQDGVKKLICSLEQKMDKKSRRDYALLRLLYDLALRRNEALSLDREHLNMEASTVEVLGKGRRGRQTLDLTPKAKDALSLWLKERGDEEGPLFIALDNSSYGKRLKGGGLYAAIQKIGRAVGLKVRPHGLRHAAITEALDATNGDVRAVQQFSRHKSLDMVMVYDDKRKNLGGKVAQMISQRT